MNPFPAIKRIVRSRIGSMPDFIVIGVQKSGTTSFYNYLCQHPRIFGGLLKEPGFFNYHFDEGINWYRSNFPVKGPSWLKAFCVPSSSLLFEATSSYFFAPKALTRIKQQLPDAKFLIVLRHPTDRTLSHYRYKPQHPNSADIFRDTILKEIDAIQGREEELYAIWDQQGSLESAKSITTTYYVLKSLYCFPMRRWFEEFPREQFLILKADDLFNEPQTVLDQAFDFLSVDRIVGKNFQVHNPSTKIPVSEDVIEKLDLYFEPFIEEFFSITGVRIPPPSERK